MQGIITTPELQQFQANLPRKPYCCDHYSQGLVVRAVQHAIKRDYIQPNHPDFLHYLAFDIDVNCWEVLEENHGLRPNLAMINPTNNKGHFLLRIKDGIYKGENANRKFLKYASDIESKLTGQYGADFGYTGTIVKNPLSSSWRVFSYRSDPWDFDELNEYITYKPLERPKTDFIETNTALGRNCQLFDEVRLKHAYRSLQHHKDNGSFETFKDFLFSVADKINGNFTNPLAPGEVVQVVKSIAKWTWSNYEPKINRGRDTAKGIFLGNTKDKQVLAAVETNKQRKNATERKIRSAIYSIKADGQKVTQKRIAEVSGLSTRTIREYKELVNSLK